MNAEDPSIPKEPIDKYDYTQENVLRMAEQGFMPALVDRLSIIDTQPGDILVFRFLRKMEHKQRENLVNNFNAWLSRRGLLGIFIPADLELTAVMNHPAAKTPEGIKQVDDLEKARREKAASEAEKFKAAEAEAQTPGEEVKE